MSYKAISPKFARDMEELGFDRNVLEPEANDGTLEGLAAQTIQPYRPGWQALPGVASSIIGGLAMNKLNRNRRQRAAADDAAYRTAMGSGGVTATPAQYKAGQPSPGMPTPAARQQKLPQVAGTTVNADQAETAPARPQTPANPTLSRISAKRSELDAEISKFNKAFDMPMTGRARQNLYQMRQRLIDRRDRLDALELRMGQGGAPSGPKFMKSGRDILAIAPDGRTRVIHRGQPSQLEQMQSRILGQLLPQQLQQPQGGLQLQSSEITSTDPNLIKTQTAAPQQQPRSPLDNLSQAERLGMGLNMIKPGLGNQLIKSSDKGNFAEATTNEIEKKIFGAEEQYAQLRELQSQYKPEYQTIEGRLRADWYNLIDRLRVSDQPLNPEQQKYLADFSQFKRRGLEAINDYIKRITGAQMSEAEADRLRQAMADVGEGIFDGDGPTQYKAKLDDSIKSITMARARYHFLLKGGWQGTQMSPADIAQSMQQGNAPISLQDMEQIIKRRTGAIYQRMKSENPDADDGELRQNAIAQGRKEFGI